MSNDNTKYDIQADNISNDNSKYHIQVSNCTYCKINTGRVINLTDMQLAKMKIYVIHPNI